MYVACHFGESSHYVCITEYTIFSVTREHHWHIDETSHPRKREGPLFAQPYVHVVLRDLDVERRLSFNYPHYLNQCGSHLWVSAQRTSSHRPLMFLSGSAAFAGSRASDIKHFWLYASASRTADPVRTVNDGNYSEGSRVLFISH